MPAQVTSPASSQTEDTSHLLDDSGDTGRPMPSESGTMSMTQNELPRVPTEEDFKDVLTPGADFAAVEGDVFGGDVSISNDSLGGTRK